MHTLPYPSLVLTCQVCGLSKIGMMYSIGVQGKMFSLGADSH